MQTQNKHTNNGGTVDYWQADIIQSTDYSPFGVQLDGRSFGDTSYSRGFQGQEQDRETGLVNYTYRMHNPRLGRFFAVDPLSAKYPFYSSYQFSSNSPIIAIELEGLESSVILNYPELSVTLDINENGIINITNDKFLQLQKNKYAGIRNETGSFYKDFEHYIEVPCYDCGVRNNYGTIAKIGIVIYSNDVIREMEVGSTPFNRYGGQKIKIDNKALNVKDYNSKGISTDNINQAVNNLLNRANGDLNDVPVNAQGISLTIFVNSDLSKDKQNSIKTQVGNKFSAKMNVNIDFKVFDYSGSDDKILLQYNIEADVPQMEDVTIPPIEFVDD